MFRTLMREADREESLRSLEDRVMVLHMFVDQALMSRIMYVPASEIPERMLTTSDAWLDEDESLVRLWWSKYKHSVISGSGTYHLIVQGRTANPWQRSQVSVLIIQCQQGLDSLALWTVL